MSGTLRRVAYDFSGEVAVVTGGAGGIGGAIVERLRSSGARVVVWDAADRRLGPGDAVCDLTDADAVAAALHTTRDRVGAPTMLVTCAGVVGARTPLLDLDDTEWRRTVDVNVGGVLVATRAVVPAMIEAGRGRVVHVGSMTGIDANEGFGAYSATKAAVHNLTQAMGKEWAAHGVRVNAVAPGMVDSPFIAQMPADYVIDRVGKSSLGRLIRPDEVASAALWLLSEDCSFLTGYTLALAGGRR